VRVCKTRITCAPNAACTIAQEFVVIECVIFSRRMKSRATSDRRPLHESDCCRRHPCGVRPAPEFTAEFERPSTLAARARARRSLPTRFLAMCRHPWSRASPGAPATVSPHGRAIFAGFRCIERTPRRGLRSAAVSRFVLALFGCEGHRVVPRLCYSLSWAFAVLRFRRALRVA